MKSSKQRKLTKSIDEQLMFVMNEMKGDVSDTERLILANTVESLSRAKMSNEPLSFESEIEKCLNEMEVCRLKGDLDAYNRLANSLDALTKSRSNMASKDGGIQGVIINGVVTLFGTFLITYFDKLHVLPKTAIDFFKFLSRR